MWDVGCIGHGAWGIGKKEKSRKGFRINPPDT
jgi:hypothetical protein